MGSNPSTFQRFDDSSQHPVERVSWQDAQEFIARVLRSENRSLNGEFSLPTEAEWEYACRAGSTERFACGEDAGLQELQHSLGSILSRKAKPSGRHKETEPLGAVRYARQCLGMVRGHIRLNYVSI